MALIRSKPPLFGGSSFHYWSFAVRWHTGMQRQTGALIAKGIEGVEAGAITSLVRACTRAMAKRPTSQCSIQCPSSQYAVPRTKHLVLSTRTSYSARSTRRALPRARDVTLESHPQYSVRELDTPYAGSIPRKSGVYLVNLSRPTLGTADI